MNGTTLYAKTQTEAVEAGEIQQWRDNAKLNRECAASIAESISEHYSGNHLAVEHILSDSVRRYGMERTKLILANTARQLNWDGRVHPKNKEWGESVFVPDERDSTLMDWRVKSHPALVDGVLSAWRRQEGEMQRVQPEEPAHWLKSNQLQYKLNQEQRAFGEYMTSLPPEEILSHCYEYAMREDLCGFIEDCELTDRQVTALLESPDALSGIFENFCKKDCLYNEQIMDSIKEEADKSLEQRSKTDDMER